LDGGVDQPSVEADRVFAGQAQLNGDIGTVSLTCLRQAAIEQDLDGSQSGQAIALFHGSGKTLGGTPGPQCMRTGWADADLEHVKYGDRFVWQGESLGKYTAFSLPLFFTSAGPLLPGTPSGDPFIPGILLFRGHRSFFKDLFIR